MAADPSKPRRPKGEGGLHKVTIGDEKLWRANRTVKHNGKPKRITGTGGSKEEARARLEDNYKRFLIRIGELHPESVPPRLSEQKLTTGEWLYLWHSRLSREIDEHTLRNYRGRIELHLVPHIGHIPLKQLRREQLDTLFRETLPAKRKTVQGKETGEPLLGGSALVNIYVVLNMALKRAVIEEKIFRNPLAGVERPRRSKRRQFIDNPGAWGRTFLSLLEANKNEDIARWSMALMYGMRQSERLGLRWRDINLAPFNGTITINGQLARRDVRHGCGTRNPETLIWPCGEHMANKCPKAQGGGGYYYKTETKTESSRRQLPLIEPVRTYLLSLRDEIQPGWKATGKWKPLPAPFMDELVFTTPTGQPLRQQEDNEQFQELIRTLDYPDGYFADIPNLGPTRKRTGGLLQPVRGHDLRHIAVSLMIGELNVPIEIVSKIVGHSSTKVTSEVYSHLTNDQKKKPLEEVSRWLLSMDAEDEFLVNARMRPRLPEEADEEGEDTGWHQSDSDPIPPTVEDADIEMTDIGEAPPFPFQDDEQ